MNKVIAYTDGGCRANGKAENIGAIGVLMTYGPHKKEISLAYKNTTNNRMEIQAAIEALRAMKKFNVPIEIRTDSAYLCNCIQKKWYVSWMNNGWLTSAKKPVENKELWQELIQLIEKFSFISFVKVKGHSTNEGNNRADELVNLAMDKITK